MFSGEEIATILESQGFERMRQKGSHLIMQKKTQTTVTVPIPMHKEVRIGTLQSIIRQSGLHKNLFQV
ncbi:MAG: type II toxin-antitoxin system HicA family toxin [Verrucomicrobiae bacterium]|nr:type II toxin-antitoxin system HicA family toxin [Verrucomicrobiae bacterium]